MDGFSILAVFKINQGLENGYAWVRPHVDVLLRHGMTVTL